MQHADETDIPARRRVRQMPRPAIRAIAWSGHFCALMTCFLVYFAVRHQFHPGLIAFNIACAAFLFVGSLWMQRRLRS
jgi:hypothetical protein